MTKALIVDRDLLLAAIARSGLKMGYIAEILGLSRQGFDKKIKGKTPFRIAEARLLSILIHLSEEEEAKIFTPRVEKRFDKD